MNFSTNANLIFLTRQKKISAKERTIWSSLTILIPAGILLSVQKSLLWMKVLLVLSKGIDLFNLQ